MYRRCRRYRRSESGSWLSVGATLTTPRDDFIGKGAGGTQLPTGRREVEYPEFEVDGLGGGKRLRWSRFCGRRRKGEQRACCKERASQSAL